ncbi:MAG TPA: hypothetical protein VGC42_09090, partial [Kofleriaceae bacterium]
MEGDDPPPPAPEPYVRRKAKTLPPPAPGSAARKALGPKLTELGDVFDSLDDDGPPSPPPPPARSQPRALTDVLGGAELDFGDDEDDDGAGADVDDDDDEPAPPPQPAAPPPARAAPPSAGSPRAKPPTGAAPAVKKRYDGGDPLDLSAIPASDKTQENRGAVGQGGAHRAALTGNAVSGTIGDQTPEPVFDRAALAASQKGALATERVRPAARTGAARSDAASTGAARSDAARGDAARSDAASTGAARSAAVRSDAASTGAGS